MQENVDYVTRDEHEDFRTELLGNRKPLFKGDNGRIGKLDDRLARLEKVFYGGIGIMIFLKIVEPWIAKLGVQ